ncbi:MAG: cyclic nucleotide-binding domain-containing protein [Geminicoccaceae bacterium]|nr:cyclic nucleotide-binding domain-containing protein [Geminicoccaceae bacterium]MCX7630542.1 cyclic nucleotide-binding domain-containing protein [Geminicoccaceae bacterium]MDW8371458.1 cyclic nucleotide-binding domain-containing protein [Geminicoccaceae bacterium]
MSLQRDLEALRAIPLFAKVEPARLKLLAFTSEHIDYEPGEIVCRQGEPGDAAYILLEGSADVLVDTPSGRVKVATLGKNEIVGEIAILCDVPRTATVVAATRLHTLKIAKDGFLNLVTQFPHVAVEIMSELAARLHATTQRLTQVSLRLAELESRRP